MMDNKARVLTFRLSKGHVITDLEREVGYPWPEAYIFEEENGDFHIAPSEYHRPDVDCWCDPIIDTSNENIWLHRNISKEAAMQQKCPGCGQIHGRDHA